MPAAFILETTLTDAAGQVVARASQSATVALARTEALTQTLTLPAPRRWQGRRDPYLYTATIRLLDGDRVLDTVSQPLGLRTVAITQEQGFLLNDQPYPVHGVNRHQDKRNQGWALTAADEQLDASLMREMGVTAVRNAHYPQSESWHALADRDGTLLWDEIPLVNETRASREFWLTTEEQLREMIHQLYNHPSIAWWGLFNELENSSSFVPPSGPELTRLRAIIEEIDPRRLIVAASDRAPRYFNRIPRQLGFNTYPGWYGKADPANPVDLKSVLTDRFQEAGQRFCLSEYGAGGNIAHHAEGAPVRPLPSPVIPFHSEEWQAFSHERNWAQIVGDDRLWGTFVWVMFDFSVNGRDEGNIPCLNDKGLVTHDRRFRKDAFYFYKANWNPEPMVYFASRRATPRQSATDDLKAYSNCAEVELRLNGRVIGRARPDATAIVRWPAVALQPGENRIELTGFGPVGPLATDSCHWVVQPAAANP